MSRTNPVRILMVLGNTGRGGSQSYVLNILRNINREMFNIDFAVYEEKTNGYSSEIHDLGSKIWIVPHFNGVNYLKCKRKWTEVFDKGGYDIVHGHATNAAFIYLRVAQRQGVHTILHSHSAGYRGNPIQQKVKAIFSDLGKKYAEYWFACSEKAAIKLYGNRYQEYSKYFQIPNAIETDKYLFRDKIRISVRKSLGITSSNLLIGHVGSFSMPKNHSFLVEIFARIKEKNDKAKLVLCGDGFLQTEISNKVKQLGLSNDVLMVGNIPNVQDYLMAMDIMIFPSLFEGLPVSVVEAQATGLPVILSDSITKEVALSKLVTVCGLTKSYDEWADKALGTDIDINERTRYNEIIGQTQFNIKRSITKLESIYLEIANK